MKDFKFFQKGTVEDPQMLDESTFITASFNDDTPEGHMGRRRMYHTDINLYGRLRYRQDIPRPQLGTEERHRDIIRRINEARDLNDNPIRLFQTTTTVNVNPTPWTKIKIFFKDCWSRDPTSTIAMSASLTALLFLGIVKLFQLW
jgi:hypothetical protein